MADKPAAPGKTASPIVAASGTPSTWTSPAATGFLEAYGSFAKTLRTWLVGFGVGVPVVVASQSDLASSLAMSGHARLVVTLYLLGVSIQIAATLLYKSVMWYSYYGEGEPAFQATRRYRVSVRIADLHWLELGFDVLTIGMFVAATFSLLQAVL